MNSQRNKIYLEIRNKYKTSTKICSIKTELQVEHVEFAVKSIWLKCSEFEDESVLSGDPVFVASTGCDGTAHFDVIDVAT